MSRPERVAGTIDALLRPLPDALWDELERLLPPPHLWLDAPLDR